MRIRISPSRACGSVAAPPSKSMAHRLLISAALSHGESRLRGVSLCEDVAATVDSLRALGIDCTLDGTDARVRGGFDVGKVRDGTVLPCRESGSTLRFLLPLALLSSRECLLVGAPSLLRRPMTVYETICREHGLGFSQTEEGIRTRGPLSAGEYTLPGNVSSQFVSGMLFALTQTEGESILHVTPPIESASYIRMTVAALCRYGAKVEWIDKCTLRVRGAHLLATDADVEGDFSGAAFLEAFRLFGGDVTVTGLDPDSLQGDRVYRAHFASLSEGNACISLADCPDLAPVLFAVAAAKHGGRFTDTARLKIKESDRAEVMAQELRKFGTTVRVYENAVEVEPNAFHAPTEMLLGHNDHRIVMALAVIASLVGGEIEGAEAVAKSFPDFFDRIRSIGIDAAEF